MTAGRIGLLALLVLISCVSQQETPLIRTADYSAYLDTSRWTTATDIQEEIEFWSSRLRPDSSGLGELAPLASAYARLYDFQSDYDHLLASEALLQKAVSVAAIDKKAYVRALSRTLIKQHRFSDALSVFTTEYAGTPLEVEDHFLLFDCYLEIGKSEQARTHLQEVEDRSQMGYLIRLAKLLDSEGDLPAAIRQLEEARRIALSRNQQELIEWTTSNLADFYVHAGRLEEAYALYLEVIRSRPDHFHSWQGLAWLAYSVEKDVDQAIRILDTLVSVNESPEYVLRQLDMARYVGDSDQVSGLKNKFLMISGEDQQGGLYRIPHAYEILEQNLDRTEDLLELETKQRQTDETIVLLATIRSGQGQREEALELMEKIAVQSAEPITLYHMAKLYKDAGNREEVFMLRQLLKDASVELGPNRVRQLESH
ncbi:tetratricopeptide repeat protein [Aureitalea marina]|uniref:Uncharacterized protein n=1 Tax=Aureitalea marina TaxID=930804 RepID=A0A2S7KPU6_9FLAO|nr:tetratricopeptide repeat protein [Aureitalea marina]PQB04627.1 hypothetical protein BST85_06755 [Aureitalea marina]